MHTPRARSSGKHGGIGGGDGFEDRFFHRQMRLMHGAESAPGAPAAEAVTTWTFASSRAHSNALRIAVTGAAIQHEILRAHLQHHAGLLPGARAPPSSTA